MKEQELERIYANRFTESDLAFKREVWAILSRDFFQRYVEKTDTVLDLGAGTCEFINSIECAEKIAFDANPDVQKHAKGARVVIGYSTDMSALNDSSVDVVFNSNFFEHLPSKDDLLQTLRECLRVLRSSGRLLTLMPNIRYLGGKYWDYFDHHTPLTHLSLTEALTLTGFSPEKVIPRFLPYTVKDRRMPRALPLLRLYLRLPIFWPILGRQMFVVARKP